MVIRDLDPHLTACFSCTSLVLERGKVRHPPNFAVPLYCIGRVTRPLLTVTISLG
jgi:hypothetical protein